MRFTIGCVAAKIVLVQKAGRNLPSRPRYRPVPGHEATALATAGPEASEHSQGISRYPRVVGQQWIS